MHHVQPTAVRFILGNCTDAARTDEFNDWYNAYGASLTRAPFFRNVVRYEAPQSDPRYVTLYDIDSAYSGLAWPMTRVHPAKLGPPNPLLDVVLRGTYERMEPKRPLILGRAEKFVTFVLSDCTDPAAIPGIDAWFDEFMFTTSAFNASRYALVEGLPEPPHYLEVYESDLPLDVKELRLDQRPQALVTRQSGTYELRNYFPEFTKGKE